MLIKEPCGLLQAARIPMITVVCTDVLQRICHFPEPEFLFWAAMLTAALHASQPCTFQLVRPACAKATLDAKEGV